MGEGRERERRGKREREVICCCKSVSEWKTAGVNETILTQSILVQARLRWLLHDRSARS